MSSFYNQGGGGFQQQQQGGSSSGGGYYNSGGGGGASGHYGQPQYGDQATQQQQQQQYSGQPSFANNNYSQWQQPSTTVTPSAAGGGGSNQQQQAQQQTQQQTKQPAPFWNPGASGNANSGANLSNTAASLVGGVMAQAATGGLNNEAIMNTLLQGGREAWVSGGARMIPGLEAGMLMLRTYFAVDNRYVKRKMQKVLFPFLSKQWRRFVRTAIICNIFQSSSHENFLFLTRLASSVQNANPILLLSLPLKQCLCSNLSCVIIIVAN